ncbi:MAG: RagB/SusD family nutrient uptake outer membrane protein [Bacteroidales bacterium]|nr:RagB/SusD family nutrient uptake outer membrane protein [Bacteroidales bacterium]
MKKTLYLIAILAAGSFFATSCDSLERYPEDKYSQENFWKTQTQVEMAITSVYAIMQKPNGMARTFAFDCLGGLAVTTSNDTYLKVFNGTYDATITKILNKYMLCYESIARSNNIIRNIGKAEMSQELIEQFKAEALFLRALFYFETSNLYGGVPIYDETWDVGAQYDDMLLPRNTLEEVREFIHKDLDVAIAHLPKKWEDKWRGRATWGAAMALQGKVYLYEKNYDKARECFEAIIESGIYHLNPDYAALFTIPGDACSEMIFSIECVGDYENSFGLPLCNHMGTKSTYSNTCSGDFTANTAFVDTYEYKNGDPFSWETAIPGVEAKTIFTSKLGADLKSVTYTPYRDKLLQIWEERDPRLAASYILPYTKYKGSLQYVDKMMEYVIATGVTAANGFVQPAKNFPYPYRKFVPEGDLGGLITNTAEAPINFPLIRLADIHLMLAESYIGLNRIGDACTQINIVRARAGVALLNSGNPNLAVSNAAQATERLRMERKWELAGEGHSFMDMKRYGLLEQVAGTYADILGAKMGTRVVIERDYLWPIPAQEIAINNSLTQNPGWGE